MKGVNISFNRFLNLPLLAALMLGGCTGAEDSGGGGGSNNKSTGTSACLQDTEAQGLIQQLALADAAQGGQLYDEWWIAAGGTEPTSNHHLWDQQTSNTRTGPDTWRCKECHGWDYKGADGSYGVNSDHYTGFPGIMGATTKDPIEVFCAIRSGTTDYPEHDFSQQLSGVQILHLTKFIVAAQDELPSEPMPKGVTDTSALISNSISQGNPTNGGTLYTDGNIGCGSTNCHGPTGTAQREPLGTMANEDPWELIHKIRFGEPGATLMPAFSDNLSHSLTLNETNDIVAFAQQSLDDPGAGNGTSQPPSDLAIVVRGGRLYDNWMSESGSTSTVVNDDNPLWARQVTNTRTGPDTWRCKECHGWDYKGVDGAYGVGSDHYTGFGGIWDTQFDNVPGLVTFLTDGFPIPILGGTTTVHNFGGLINADDINALANFVLHARGTDIEDYIKPLGIILSADYAHGQELYNSKPFGVANGNCELCHGLDGKLQEPVIVGAVANENPWETLHKIRYGQPNSRMPSMEEAGFNVQDATDVVFFAQTLPIQ